MKLGELRQLMANVQNQEGKDLNLLMQEQICRMGLDPNNLYQELEMSDRFVETQRDTSDSNAHMQLHSHVFYELLYCRSGAGIEYLVGSERYRLQRGDIVFVPPGISHRPLLPENMTEPYKRYVVWLSQEFLEGCAKTFGTPAAQSQIGVGVLRTDATTQEILRELFRKGVVESEERAEGWQAAVVGNTILLLTNINRAAGAHLLRTMKAETPVLLDRITAYIEQHYAEAFAIDALAKRFFVSNSTISHLFKEKMGVSVYRYVTQRRLIAAKSLIEQGVQFDNVAVQTGFQDYSGFYRAFKQEYGISPRQYRNRYDD